MGRISTAIAANAKNYLINSNFDFWQRGTSFTPAGYIYAADRFGYGVSNGGTRTITRSSTVPNTKSIFSFQTIINTADPTLDAGDFEEIYQAVEGYNFIPLYGKTSTITFWARSSIAGNYALVLRNTGATRSYVTTYNIPTANTWQFISVTFTHDVTGSWNLSNGVGLIVSWTLQGGATTTAAAANVWAAGNFNNVAGTVNLSGTAGAQFNITQIMLNEGPVAAPFKLFGNDIGGELLACYRYCYVITNNGTNITAISSSFTAHSTGAASGVIPMPVSLRALPSVTASGTGLAGAAAGSDFRLTDNLNAFPLTSVPELNYTNNSTNREITVHAFATGVTQFRSYFLGFANTNLTRLIFSAEL